jgi:hypothetical protein
MRLFLHGAGETLSACLESPVDKVLGVPGASVTEADDCMDLYKVASTLSLPLPLSLSPSPCTLSLALSPSHSLWLHSLLRTVDSKVSPACVCFYKVQWKHSLPPFCTDSSEGDTITAATPQDSWADWPTTGIAEIRDSESS